MHSTGVSYTEAVRQFKRRYLLEVLAQHKGNQCKSAEELGMHRNTLSRTLAELDMDTAQIRNGLKRPARRERAAGTPRLQTMARVRYSLPTFERVMLQGTSNAAGMTAPLPLRRGLSLGCIAALL